MKLRFVLFFPVLLLLLTTKTIGAQVTPPLLDCIDNDTLKWINTPITCGPYLATQVFSSTSPSGPYTEIATITNAGVDQFFDANPTGQLRYYYLQYRYDCPGNPVLTSDTLDNRIPNAPMATWVSVEGNTVVINWTQSTSVQTRGYLVYRVGLTEEVIGTMSGAENTSFVDNSFTATPPTTTYYVQAIDNCNNSSLLGPEVTTATLSSSGGDGCTSVITLTADALAASVPLIYTQFELFASVNGGPFTSTGTFGGGTTTFTYDQANDGENICFYLEGSVQGQLGRPVRTPVSCVDVAITQPVRVFPLYGAGYDPAGNLVADFPWDANAAVETTQAIFVDPNGQATGVDLPFNNFTGPEVTASIPGGSLPGSSFSVSIRAEDICDNLVITNNVTPVVLSDEMAPSGVNALVWTPFTNGLPVTVAYELTRTARDGTEEIVYTGPETRFEDRVGTNDANLAQACYVVTAVVTFADGTVRRYQSLPVCQEQVPMVYLPNVFRPRAASVVNSEFCPGFSLLPTGDYELNVYDRWGGLRFTTSNPSVCWDGTSKGRLAETGVYLYVLRMEVGGRIVEKSGDVLLLK